jgi:hypothetical protein
VVTEHGLAHQDFEVLLLHSYPQMGYFDFSFWEMLVLRSQLEDLVGLWRRGWCAKDGASAASPLPVIASMVMIDS